jgi:hypothetical protein
MQATGPVSSPGVLPFVVLAGERPGGNALAQALGVPAGVLVDVAGETALSRVLGALRASRRVSGGVLCGPAGDIVASSAELERLLSAGDVRWVPPAAGPAASAVAGLDAVNACPVLLTTGDHALLTGALVDRFCDLAMDVSADIVVGLVPYDCVIAAFPDTHRTVLRFRDGAFCGSNLFLVRTPAGREAILFWRRVEQLRKQPRRIARELGWWTLLRYLAGRLTVGGAMDLLSRRAGCRVGFVPFSEARIAVDVDTVADRDLATRILLAERHPDGQHRT